MLVIQKGFGGVHSSTFSACCQSSLLCVGALDGFETVVIIFKVFLSKYKVLKVGFSFS